MSPKNPLGETTEGSIVRASLAMSEPITAAFQPFGYALVDGTLHVDGGENVVG